MDKIVLDNIYLTAQDRELVAFYNALDPEQDFAYVKSPAAERVDYDGGGKVKTKKSGKPPLEFKLVETYVDLGLAIRAGKWDAAYLLYRYLKRMLT
jgi:hypothetical protein